MGPGLSRQEAELGVLRLTGRVRDASQRVRHLHALQQERKREFLGFVSAFAGIRGIRVSRSRGRSAIIHESRLIPLPPSPPPCSRSLSLSFSAGSSERLSALK